ncbi:hypothetical protein [Prosthecobacter sp.]|uniref:hypothetical protein n=1 Tax=Prosthecobacter sp. TaxID=1965333 RepID=UPI001D2F56FE|nr:hypothetical protein [Prosthecobacter sp.]MCB1279747.1 hypothetical protein [Prosthecobacter sp.]
MQLPHILTPVLLVASVILASDPGPTFADRVKKVLASDWTEMTVSTALVTDYGAVIGIAIHLRRDVVTKPPLAADPTAAKQHERLSDADWKLLSDAIQDAARTTFEHKYPLEIYDSLPREKAEELLKSGKVKIEPTDVEVFHLTAKTSKGEVSLDESGPYQPLDRVIGQLLKTKTRELKATEVKTILGRNPYEE